MSVIGRRLVRDTMLKPFSRLFARLTGESQATNEAQLSALVYADLTKLARRHLAGKRWFSTLNTTSLVHESYLRMVSPAAATLESRDHFMNLASRIMRQIVCDHARAKLRESTRFDKSQDAADALPADAQASREARDCLRVDEALRGLEQVNARAARVVECRFFAGLTEPETARVLGISPRTVSREWDRAKEWLAEQLAGE